MEMIIGGAYQGKEQYAKKTYPDRNFLYGELISMEELFQAEGVIGLHAFIRKEMKNNVDLSTLAEELIKKNPKVILVSDEIGYGVVPIDAFDRAYREQVGRICTKLAAYSKKVTRVALGIGTVIKHA